MKAKAERDFIRKHAIKVLLNYRGFNIWLVGSDEGWWECQDNLTGKSPFVQKTWADLQQLANMIDLHLENKP